MLLDQGDEVRRRKFRERRLREVRISGGEIVRLTVEVREVAAAAAGDENLLADTISALQNRDAATALASLQRAHQSGGASAENQGIIGFNRVRAQATNVSGVRRQINTGGTIAT